MSGRSTVVLLFCISSARGVHRQASSAVNAQDFKQSTHQTPARRFEVWGDRTARVSVMPRVFSFIHRPVALAIASTPGQRPAPGPQTASIFPGKKKKTARSTVAVCADVTKGAGRRRFPATRPTTMTVGTDDQKKGQPRAVMAPAR